MAIKAVVFDFDGVIVETEEADYLAWREIWSRYDLDLPLEEWALCIGTRQGAETFSAFGELVRRTGLSLAECEVSDEQRAAAAQLLAAAPAVDGVLEWLGSANAAGLGVAIASSSSRAWVKGHLQRIGLEERFPVIACFDDCGVPKPDPASYRLACAELGVTPPEAVAVEDSRNGLLGAKAAGLACVVVPTLMTANMDFSEADLILPSFRAATLEEVIAWLDSGTPFGAVRSPAPPPRLS
jgi:HAD superfamily hydrolase (TIGR01509 family)